MQNSPAESRPSDPDGVLRLRGRVWTGRQESAALLRDGVVEIDSGTIRSVRAASCHDAPAPRDDHGQPLTLVPGLVDLHNHGGAGHSFPSSGPAGCRTAVDHHRSQGTTTMLASLVSAPADALIQQAGMLAQAAASGQIAGIHAEGPFLSPARCGAQDPQALLPGDPELLTRLIRAAQGQLRSLTLAPETEHLDELLSICAEHSVVVGLGHSDASADQTQQALAAARTAGATVMGTHQFNGMPALHHRAPGIAGALMTAAAEDAVTVELIADGVHLDDATVGLMLAAAPQRVAFVSDAMAAAGTEDGDYTLGDMAVTVRDGVARLSSASGAEGSIAGGTSTVSDQLLRHAGEVLLETGAPSDSSHDEPSEAAQRRAVQVLRACTVNPARAIGLSDRGTLDAGKRADLVQFDSAGRVVAVLSEGSWTSRS